MIDWFDAKEAQEFGTELARFFIENVPPASSAKKDKSLGRKKEVLGKLIHKVERFKTQSKLNFYKKAKFGNAFQWALKDAGYDSVFVDELTKELLLKL